MAFRELQEAQEHQALMEQVVTQEYQEQMAFQELREAQVLQVLMVQMVLMVVQV